MAWPSTVSAGDQLAASFFNGIINSGVNVDNDNALGAHYLDVSEITEPSAPAAGSRRLFVDDVSGELTIIRSDSTTRSLESASGNTVTRGAGASRPASGTLAGDLYIHTDEPYISFWSGSAWVLMLRGNAAAVSEPGAGNWRNQSDGSVNTNYGGLRFDIPPRADAECSFYEYTYSGTVITAALRPFCRGGGTMGNPHLVGGGVGFAESGTGKLVLFTLGPDASGIQTLAVTRWASPTTVPEFAKMQPLTGIPEFTWMRIEDDTTDIVFEVSPDGNLWEEFYREGRAAFFDTAPDRYGFGGFTMDGSGAVDLHVAHSASS